MSLRFAMLAVLADGPATGYEITKTFEAQMRYFWVASHQQIYRDLKTLAVEGLVSTNHVSQPHRPDKIIYQLTKSGQEALRDWARTAVEPKINSELLIKASAAAAFGPSEVIALLKAQRNIHVKRLEGYRQIEQQVGHVVPDITPLAEVIRLMTLRRGIRGEEDWIGWIDEALLAVGMAKGATPEI
jgi:PadR family transcriptional regulator, regulatory protein AphA